LRTKRNTVGKSSDSNDKADGDSSYHSDFQRLIRGLIYRTGKEQSEQLSIYGRYRNSNPTNNTRKRTLEEGASKKEKEIGRRANSGVEWRGEDGGERINSPFTSQGSPEDHGSS
jgi:hypothetical protein